MKSGLHVRLPTTSRGAAQVEAILAVNNTSLELIRVEPSSSSSNENEMKEFAVWLETGIDCT